MNKEKKLRIRNSTAEFLIFTSFCFLAASIHAKEADYGISGNPGAVNVLTGTGYLGESIGIPATSGVRLGGVWLGDYNFLMKGASAAPHHRHWTGNSSLILDLYLDLEKAFGWKLASFGVEFLQFNGQPTNADAGVVQGYNSLPGDPPLNRSELYQLWVRQGFVEDKLVFRVGKMVPTYHFNNVSKPVPTTDPAVSIPAVSGLIYTPIFVNPTLLGAIGGYYNSVYGVVATVAPRPRSYVNLAMYDGNVALGVQTGLKGPHFNGHYFYIGEAGYGWSGSKPGIAAVGGWHQSGLLKEGSQKERGTGGVYAFGSKALWIKKAGEIREGNLSGFLQFGWNHSKTLQMNLFVGGGLTGFAMIPHRPNDSFGLGVSWSRLNPHQYARYGELMFQGYYQGQVYKTTYLQPVLSYIPNPGAHPHTSNALAATLRLIALF